MDTKQFRNLVPPALPSNDISRLNDPALSLEYDKLSDAISKQAADVKAYLSRAKSANGIPGGARALEKELTALRTEKLRLAVAGVELVQARAALKNRLRQVHRAAQMQLEAKLETARQRKTEELRAFCNGQLPNLWDDTIVESLLPERMAAHWTPTFANEANFHPAQDPVNQAEIALKAIVIDELGFDPNI
jgi:hypothetical protein